MVIATTFRHGYAVVVGIGADLAATVRDAFGLHELLTDPRRCAYPADQARLLTEGAAGRSGILVALDELADRCAADPEATVIIFYSGHGGHRDGDGTYFLVPHGFRWDDFDRTAITAEDFVAKVRAVRAKRLLVLLDCCHAGSFAEAKNFIKSPPPPEAIEQLSRGEGRAVVASSRAGELSYAGTPYSIFTAALLEGLAGYGSSRRDGYAELFDVLVWIRDQVPCRSGGKQNPILSSDSLTLSFPLALYAGGQDHPKPLEWSSSRLDLGGSTGVLWCATITLGSSMDFAS